MSRANAPAAGALRDWIKQLGDPVLRSLTAHASDVIMVLDLQARIQFINWTAGGLTVEGVLGQEVYGYVPAEQVPAMRECFELVAGSSKPGRYHNVYTNPVDGAVTFWESRVAPVLEGGGVLGFVVISSDITERREAAAQRELLFSLSLDMLCVADFDGYFRRINPALCRTLQYSAQELMSRPYLSFVHPDDLSSTAAAAETLAQGRDVVDFENRYRRKDGQYRTFSWRVTADPLAKMVFAVARDVTEQRALEVQLRQSQKMDAVGQLAGGVAHDFNNLLLAILVHTELAQGRSKHDPTLSEHLAEVMRASQRATDLVKQLLAFGRRAPSRVVPVDMNKTAEGLLAMLRRLLPENIAIEFSPGDGPVVVDADPSQMEQILLNLCLNARDAMPTGGRLRLATRRVEAAAAPLARAGEAGQVDCLRLSVSDTGHGIPAEHRERIFEPFFTTKEPGRGTGLGLATAYAIVRQHHGAINVESELDVGSRFDVYLPLSTSVVRPVPVESVRVVQAGQGTILVAEDEDLVRSAVAVILQGAGYGVLEARNGLEALRILEAGAEVSLVLLDVVMPELGGVDTLRRLRERWPQLKVILTSGYDEQPRSSAPLGTYSLLEKPYRIDDLLKRLQEALASP